MTIETAKKVLDTIFFTSSINVAIEFQGGESLLNWEVTKFFIEQARFKALHLKKTLVFQLVTNLVLMDDEKMKFLLDNDVQISTSLDGNEETHNYNRTYSKGNSFEKVTYWIKRINEEYKNRGIKRKIGALLTPTKKTLSLYKEAIDTYVELGLDSIFLRPLNPYGFAIPELKTLGYSPEEYIDFFRKCLEYVLELNKK
jgi:sulfatase maturation enzyme AslB (radical SAM superfamily)